MRRRVVLARAWAGDERAHRVSGLATKAGSRRAGRGRCLSGSRDYEWRRELEGRARAGARHDRAERSSSDRVTPASTSVEVRGERVCLLLGGIIAKLVAGSMVNFVEEPRARRKEDEQWA